MRDETLWWDEERGSLFLVNQTQLPSRYEVVECRNVERLAEAILCLEVRGAPALGVSGGYGVALAARTSTTTSYSQFLEELERQAELLKATRPTAINLSWGIDRVLDRVNRENTLQNAKKAALDEAQRIAWEDADTCVAIGAMGATLLPDGCTVLTHCNAGALACTRWGTALGVIRSAIIMGREIRVIASETRPLLQGARLTAWELARDGISVTVIPDSAAASLMRKGEIDVVLVGADRVTEEVVFNKIGTYMHAVTAHHHQIPFYVAAPLSTFDPVSKEKEVMIEERGEEELRLCGDRIVIPENAGVRNPAFDATPLSLVTGIITEREVFFPPLDIPRILSAQPPL
ncbi:MAG: S-methyl-5-thioribose-1-phosphate isomerase [Methanomicrobiales archaeon]|nr:S-methyl-5-thioribose-1-phosphate isomerase [Methanomicrobiales archaeon]